MTGVQTCALPISQRTIEDTKKNQEMLRAAKQLSDEYRAQQNIQLQQLAIAGQMAGMTQNEVQIQQAVNAVIKSTQASVEAIAKRREDAAGRGASAKVIKEYDAVHMVEGCLSFPLLALSITRAKEIDVEYQDFTGTTHTAHFNGISARCFLHELDHKIGRAHV